MQNHMTKNVFRNSKVLHFLGVKSEFYHFRTKKSERSRVFDTWLIFRREKQGKLNVSNFELSQDHMHITPCDLGSFDIFLSSLRVPPVSNGYNTAPVVGPDGLVRYLGVKVSLIPKCLTLVITISRLHQLMLGQIVLLIRLTFIKTPPLRIKISRIVPL